MNNQRLDYFDFIKALAILFVLNGHFVDHFCGSYFSMPPFSYLLHGFSAKFGVSLFACVSGYFAYVSGSRKGDSVRYAFKRYLFFFLSCLISNSLVCLFKIYSGEAVSFGMVIGQSIVLGNYFCPSFWFMKDFLIGSVICFLIGKYEVGDKDIAFLTVLLLICQKFLLGTVISGILICTFIRGEKASSLNIWIKFFLAILFFFPFFITRKYDGITQVLDAVRAFVLMSFIYDHRIFEIAYKNPLIPKIGSMTLALLTAHHLFTDVFDRFPGIGSLPKVLVYVLWLLPCMIFAVLLNEGIRRIYQRLMICEEKLLSHMIRRRSRQ